MAADDVYPALRPRTPFEEYTLLPFKQAISRGRSRVADLLRRVDTPAFLAQHPAKAVPFVYSKIFDVTLTAARRNGAVGFLASAPVADLDAYVKPRDSNILVGRDGAFYLCSMNAACYVSLTYDANPSFGTYTFVNSKSVSDIFDRAVEDNGGGLQCNFFFGHQSYEDKPNVCFDLILHDKRRGRRIHDGHLPSQIMGSQNLGGRDVARSIRFDPNTEIEPRVRLLEVRMGSLLDTTAAYDAAQFKGYLNIMFEGFKVLA